MKRKEVQAPSEADLRNAQIRVSLLEHRLYGTGGKLVDALVQGNGRLAARVRELEAGSGTRKPKE